MTGAAQAFILGAFGHMGLEANVDPENLQLLASHIMNATTLAAHAVSSRQQSTPVNLQIEALQWGLPETSAVDKRKAIIEKSEDHINNMRKTQQKHTTHNTAG